MEFFLGLGFVSLGSFVSLVVFWGGILGSFVSFSSSFAWSVGITVKLHLQQIEFLLPYANYYCCYMGWILLLW